MRQTIIAVGIALIAVIFALQNSDVQLLKLFFWEVEMPLSLLILLSLIIGVISGMLIMTRPYLQKRAEASALRKQNTNQPNSSSK